jgi:hypothetical protein
MTTLFSRKIDQAKMDIACTTVINLLRQGLGLEIWECYFVIETLYKSFPKEDLK